MYAIDYKPRLRLLDIRWLVPFDRAVLADYALDVKHVFLRSNIRAGYLLSMDMRASGVQAQDVLPAFQRHFHGFPKAHRIAIITADPATRCQVKEQMRQSYLSFFDERETAMRWLTDNVLEFTE